jgi:hypothetical protein
MSNQKAAVAEASIYSPEKLQRLPVPLEAPVTRMIDFMEGYF